MRGERWGGEVEECVVHFGPGGAGEGGVPLCGEDDGAEEEGAEEGSEVVVYEGEVLEGWA